MIERIIDNLGAALLIIICVAVFVGIIIAITWPFWVGLWAIIAIFGG